MYEQLKALINQYIKTNGSRQITGAVLNNVLNEMVNSLGGASGYGGIITTTSQTPANDANIFYIAIQQGNYTNFGITVNAHELAFVKRSGNGWAKDAVPLGTGIVANPQGEATEQLSKIEIDGTIYTNPQGPAGQDAYQPFKGTFATQAALEAAYPTPNAGDTAYVEATVNGNDVLEVWDVVSGAWNNTHRTVDSPQFESGEFLNTVNIDDTHLVNPKSGALPTADDVLQLKAKLEGVTASETKVTQQPITGSFVRGANGTIGSVANTAYIEVQLGDAKSVRFLGGWFTPSGYTSGYAFGHYTDPSDSTTWVTDKSSVFDADASTLGTKQYIIVVPEGATHFRTTTATGTIPALAQNFYCYLQSGDTVKEYVDNKFIESKDYVDDIVQGEVTEVIETINPTQEDEIVASLDASNFASSTYASSTYRAFKINIERESSIARSIRIVAREHASTYYFIARNEVPLATGQSQSSQISGSNMASNYTAECNVPASGSLYRAVVPLNTEVTIELTPDAKWLYIQKNFLYTTPPPFLQTPELIELTTQIREGGLEDEIEDLRNEIQNNNNGNFELHLKNSTTLLTSPISLSKGFFLSVTNKYRVGNAILVNGDGETLDAYFRYEANRTNYNNDLYRFISNVNCIADCYVIYEIFKADGGEITNTDGVIENFCYIDDIATPMLPDSIQATIYRAFLKKLQTLIGFKWQPIGKVPYSFGDRTYRYLAGKTYIGVNYSGPEEFGTTVGIHVSMLTFFTALQNPRSVVYTEKITTAGGMTATSAYGYVYATANSEAGCFYGCVCTGLTSYLIGLKRIVSSSYWGGLYGTWFANTFDVVFEGEVPDGGNEATITDSENHTYHYGNELDEKTLVAKLQPMDFIWNQGHCLVISSIYKDKYGEVKYIVLSEQTTPTSVSTAYTPEFFFKRYKNYIESNKAWKVLRRKTDSDWTLDNVAIPRIGMDAEYCIMDGSQYMPNNTPVIDPDITTFAGEYAAFAIGDYEDNENNHKLYLNIHRGGASGYTNLQIFNEEDDVLSATPLADIAIDVNGGNVAQSNILDNDTTDDWIVYNLMNYWNTNLQTTTGKFKARVVRKEGGTITQESGCTHFAMVYIHDLEIEPIVGVNDKVYFNFNVKGGTPINLSNETSYGFLGEMPWYDLTEDDYTTNPSGEYEGHFQSKKFSVGYMRLYVKTDYGVVNKRIKIV